MLLNVKRGAWFSMPHSLCNYIVCVCISSKFFAQNLKYIGIVLGTKITRRYAQLQHITHWGGVTHKCVGKLTIIGSDNGLSPERRQAIIWTNAVILLVQPLGTIFSEILIRIQIFSLKNALENVVCEMASILSRPQCVCVCRECIYWI